MADAMYFYRSNTQEDRDKYGDDPGWREASDNVPAWVLAAFSISAIAKRVVVSSDQYSESSFSSFRCCPKEEVVWFRKKEERKRTRGRRDG